MPQVQPPTLITVQRDGKKQHRIFASYQLTSADQSTNSSPALIGVNSAEVVSLSLLQIQGSANIPPMKTAQISVICAPNSDTAFPMTGTLYMVIDTQQVIAFELLRNPDAASYGNMNLTFNATFPIVASPQSTIQFVAVWSHDNMADFVNLYVNLFDFEIPAFFAGSNGVLSPWT